MLAPFSRAQRTTLAGSMMPAFIMSTYVPLSASNPVLRGDSTTFWRASEPSTPLFAAICRSGALSARRTMSTPVASSPLALILSRAAIARTSATPPPGTTPSSTAARVAWSASSMRAFFAFIATSVASPT